MRGQGLGLFLREDVDVTKVPNGLVGFLATIEDDDEWDFLLTLTLNPVAAPCQGSNSLFAGWECYRSTIVMRRVGVRVIRDTPRHVKLQVDTRDQKS